MTRQDLLEPHLILAGAVALIVIGVLIYYYRRLYR